MRRRVRHETALHAKEDSASNADERRDTLNRGDQVIIRGTTVRSIRRVSPSAGSGQSVSSARHSETPI